MEHINPTLNLMPKPTYTILDTTDYRALCAELLAALENAIGVIYHEDGTQHISTADAVITRADVALHQAEGTLSYGMGPGTREWLPISTAPEVREPCQMFVVIAMGVTIGNTKHFTTDPCCVWRNRSGEFVRWPWTFAPTHWMPLPDYDPETE